MTHLDAYRREKNLELLARYMNDHKCNNWSVFATAYFVYYKCWDSSQCQCDLDKFTRTQEMPQYVVEYLKLKVN